jgi:hypothetical protein
MGAHDKEFCSLLNAAIRCDHPDLSPPTAMLSRGINAMCVQRRELAELPFTIFQWPVHTMQRGASSLRFDCDLPVSRRPSCHANMLHMIFHDKNSISD